MLLVAPIPNYCTMSKKAKGNPERIQVEIQTMFEGTIHQIMYFNVFVLCNCIFTHTRYK